jgi:hypothetical protein
VVVSGKLPSAAKDVALVLQFRTPGGAWRTVDGGLSGPAGEFRLVTTATRSGMLRVLVVGGAADRAVGTASAPHGVIVDAVLRLRPAATTVVGGRPTTVAGTVLGAAAGRSVVLERLTPGGWVPLARAVTRQAGRFRLRFVPHGFFTALLRVRFAGDGSIGGAQAALGRVSVLRSALASWYGPGFYGHPVACGGAPLGVDQVGVAHRTLPCGTRLTLRYRGRTAHATVIDRGPFVGRRQFDLTRALKDLLGFGGVGVIEFALD